MSDDLIGIGLYSPAEAARLSKVPAVKIIRWLRGHEGASRLYQPLWRSQVQLGDNKVYLGFRDLMEVRVANLLIREGLSAQRVRAAIKVARDEFGLDHPLSTRQFRTDGRSIFIELMEGADEDEPRRAVLETFTKQYEFAALIEPSFKNIEFDLQGRPALWRPAGQNAGIVVDPRRSFGQPIDEQSSVPTAALAAAARQTNIADAARSFQVSRGSVRQAVAFEESLRSAA